MFLQPDQLVQLVELLTGHISSLVHLLACFTIWTSLELVNGGRIIWVWLGYSGEIGALL